MQKQSKVKIVGVVIGGLVLLATSVVFFGTPNLALPILLVIGFVGYFLHRHTVPPLILVNLILIGVTSLLFALGLGIGITEDYHPNSVARPLAPAVIVLFLISVASLITSLVAWFRWRKVTGKVVGVALVAYVLVLGIAGSITHSLTETNRAVYTVEHRGLIYEIPRVYNPGYWSDLSARKTDRLKIEVCDEAPSAPVYDDSYFSNRDFPCTSVPYRITPSEDVLRAPFKDGRWGFTLATSSQGLVLSDQYDADALKENYLEWIVLESIGSSVIQTKPNNSSIVSVEYETVIYLEASRSSVVEWLTICRGQTCTSYEPLPDDPQYVIQTTAENTSFENTGTVENVVWRYKERSEDALALFDSFKVGGDSSVVATETLRPDGQAGNITLPNFSNRKDSSAVNTQPYILTVEGSAADFKILSNEFEIGRFSSDGNFNYGHAIILLRKNIQNTVQIITDSPSTGIDISINRGDEVICDPPAGTLSCTFSASPAYRLHVYNEFGALPKCADTEFMSNFLADLTRYQIAYFQNYFHLDIVDLTGETPIFTDQDDSCSQSADLEFTHEAVFEGSYSSREPLHVPFGSDRSVTLLFHESDITDYASLAVGDNPATTAHLLLSLNGDVRSINLAGGVRDLYLLLSEAR